MLLQTGPRCGACKHPLDDHALFCGACGRRTRIRHDSHTGMVVGDTYRIEEKLAEGGFGAVYRVTHIPSGLPLALKILHADFASDETIAARFRRESKALANLHDRHTVGTFERGEFRDGTLFIAMELLHGETLQERFRAGGPLPWRQVFAIMRAACSSLGEAHSRGIVHRDVKPANIHLGENDFVKVLDFGVAKVLPGSDLDDASELTFVGQAVGTLEYMSPEQLVGAACTSRSDIYQLGVVGYEMICGRRPFPEAIHPAALVTALLTQMPPLPSSLVHVPDAVDHLLLRCLERDPEHRFTSVVDLAASIDRALAPMHATGPPRESTPRIAQFHRIAMPEFDAPVRGSQVDVRPVPSTPGLTVYLLAGLASALAAALAWTLTS